MQSEKRRPGFVTV